MAAEPADAADPELRVIQVGDESKGEIQKRAEEVFFVAAPALKVTGEALTLALEAMAGAFRKAAEQARATAGSLLGIRARLSRPPARKPCAWCTESRKRPATHTVKWREPVVWWHEDSDAPTCWPAGRVMRMCEFHARIAARYSGVKIYRFRRMT